MRNISLYGIYYTAEMNEIAAEVLASGQIASGSYVKQFADEFGKLVGNKNVVTVNDMSSAIQIALRLAGVKNGEEVITTAFACMATNAPIITAGGKAIWADVDPETGTMDPDSLSRLITPNTKAVLVYHLAGYPAQIEEIAKICKNHNLKLIEDCDNALLASVNHRQVGTFGDFSVFSFYPNRQINATEGGALVCKAEEDYERALRLRRYGIDLTKFRDTSGEIDPQFDVVEIGWAATLNNLCSAIALMQIPSLHVRLNKTRENALWLENELTQAGVKLVTPYIGSKSAFWTLLILSNKRNEFLGTLKKQCIQASKIHSRTDLYSGFDSKDHEIPATQIFYEKVVGIPCGWWLTDNELIQIRNAVIAAEFN